MMVLAFKFGTYSKISEFYRFFKQIDNSLHRQILKSHLILNDLVYRCNSWSDICKLLDTIDIDFSELNVAALTKNRDFSIIPRFSNGPNLLKLIHDNSDPDSVLYVFS